MAVPISYNLRNLRVRRTTTLLTALGIGLTAAVLMSILALVEGLRVSFQATANPRHLLVMRKGSTAELISTVSRGNFPIISSRPGIERTPNGEAMASLEMVTIVALDNGEGTQQMNVTLRGLMPIGIVMREQVHLTAGRMFAPGKREAVVGRSIAERYVAARIGGKLHFGRGDYDVVGIMDGGRSAVNSEIFADLNQVSADYNRTDVLSSVLLRAEPGAQNTVTSDLEGDRQLNVMVQTERQYYEAQTVSALPLQFMGMLVAAIMAVGSSFAAMNTMFAAVARRASEIATLRVLGFSRRDILLSFLAESAALAMLGGLAGCVLVLPLNNLTTGIGSFTTFSEMTFQFHISAAILAVGMAFALVMGTLGGFFPASGAARKEILAALRGA